LADLVCLFVQKNTANKETNPKKGKVTARIHSATKNARAIAADQLAAEKLAAEKLAANSAN
jgi:hypothetical protein